MFIGHTAGAIGYRGAIEALDAGNGSQRWPFEVDPILNAKGEPYWTEEATPLEGTIAAVEQSGHLRR